MKSFLNTLASGFLALWIISCGGGSHDKGAPPDLPGPDGSETVNPDADLASQSVNTFSSQGLEITTTPSSLDFENASSGTPLKQSFTLTNKTSADRSFSLTITGNMGGFRFAEDKGVLTAFKSSTIKAGQSLKVTVQFDPPLTGTKTAFIEITIPGVDGLIKLPLRGKAAGQSVSEIKIISPEFFCDDDKAPTIDLIDFENVASQQTEHRLVKICNRAKEPVKLYTVSFKSNSKEVASKAANPQPLPEAKGLTAGTLAPPFSYDNIPETKPFTTPQPDDYPDKPLYSFSNFNVFTNSDKGPVSPQGLNIAAGSFVMLDVLFTPGLAKESAPGHTFKPVTFKARMEIATNKGALNIDTVGASSGLEPKLKIVYGKTAQEVSDCGKGKTVDLSRTDSTITFDPASIFTDWIPEDTREMSLRLCNVGSGKKPLEVWVDPITTGYFTVKPDANLGSLPLSIAPGQSKLLTLTYSPTPKPQAEVQKTRDIGAIVFRHNGANGPANRILLAGSQIEGKAIEATLGESLLKQGKNPKGKKICLVREGHEDEATTNKFVVKIKNRSPHYLLKTDWALTALPDGVTVTPASGSSEIKAGEEYSFELLFKVPKEIKSDKISGLLNITNHYPSDIQNLAQKNAPSYGIPLVINVPIGSSCAGGDDQAPDGTNIILIDRITMVLLGLSEPARNPPSFKFHLPTDFDRKNKRARVHGLIYDPLKPASPVKQIRSYAHQISSVSGCMPLPTNPYKLEFEEGSWDGPFGNCEFTSEDKSIVVKPKVACMDNNGATLEEKDGKKFTVFYHEFVRFDQDCSVMMEGKIATFAIPEGETISSVFKEMGKNTAGSREDYAKFTHIFGFNSYIHFNKPYKVVAGAPACNHQADETVKDSPEEIENCWKAFAADGENMKHTQGLLEECSYFQFEIEEGCGPEDATKRPECAGFDESNPETWKGYGDYIEDPKDDTKFNLTLRNVRITAFTLVHSLNGFFTNNSRLLYSDLFVTMTTKGIGREDPWQDIVATKIQGDFDDDGIFIDPESKKTYWSDSGVNSAFTTSATGEGDDVTCDPEKGITKHCRGNFEYRDGKLIMAGEPINLDYNRQLLLVGLSSFQGQGELAPSFARATGGRGQPLYFTFHGCVKTPKVASEETGKDADPTLDENAGCETAKLDDTKKDGQPVIEEYISRGMLSQADRDQQKPLTKDEIKEGKKNSKAWINFKIFDDDRNRLTDYFKGSSTFKFDDKSAASGTCGYGN